MTGIRISADPQAKKYSYVIYDEYDDNKILAQGSRVSRKASKTALDNAFKSLNRAPVPDN